MVPRLLIEVLAREPVIVGDCVYREIHFPKGQIIRRPNHRVACIEDLLRRSQMVVHIIENLFIGGNMVQAQIVEVNILASEISQLVRFGNQIPKPVVMINRGRLIGNLCFQKLIENKKALFLPQETGRSLFLLVSQVQIQSLSFPYHPFPSWKVKEVNSSR